MRSKHASSKILNDMGRNSLLGNRKKIAKFLMRTFTCCSTFLYGNEQANDLVCYEKAKRQLREFFCKGWERCTLLFLSHFADVDSKN
jgi:hypothetical protein